MENKFYKQIDRALKCYERHTWHEQSIDWICNRIDWCWKWRKITEAQRDELCDRAIAILNEGV